TKGFSMHGRARRLMTRALLCAALVFVPGLALAADGAISTWVSGAGSSAKTYVLKTRGTTFTGVVCGPCDDPSTVFLIADGIVIDDTHASFSIVGGAGSAPSKITLTRVDGEGSLEATVKSVSAPKPLWIEGRWVAAGRLAQQNATLKLRDGGRVWG